MFRVDEDMTLHVTRGDAGALVVMASAGEEGYLFRAGDRVRLKVFEKKNCSRVVLEKEAEAAEGAESVEIVLSSTDTKIGDVISKQVDYWYEVELNPQGYCQTIIGFDQDGAKIFRLYPEGGEFGKEAQE